MRVRAIILICAAVALALPASAVTKAELDQRINKLIMKLDEMQAKPEKAIPAATLRKAKGILLLDRTKAGFIFAYQGGSGVAMVRDTKTGKWSAPAFFSGTEASLGFQVGGQQSLVVMLIMNTNSTHQLAEPKFNFGGEASGTAGNASGGAEGTVSNQEQAIVIYTDTEGLYGGAAVKGGSVAPDPKANEAYFGEYYSTDEILFGRKGKPSDAAIKLTERLDKFSK